MSALPEKVSVRVLRATEPALLAEKVTVPSVSGFDLLCVLPPTAATETATTLRWTVWLLPKAEESVTDEARFEVAPRATTAVEVVSFSGALELEPVSVVVAILKV